MIWTGVIVDSHRIGVDDRLYARCRISAPTYWPVTADLYHDWYPAHFAPRWKNGATIVWTIDKNVNVLSWT